MTLAIDYLVQTVTADKHFDEFDKICNVSSIIYESGTCTRQETGGIDIDQMVSTVTATGAEADLLDGVTFLGKMYDDESLVKMQKECPSIRHIYKFLDEGILPTDPKLERQARFEADWYAISETGVLYKLSRRKNERVKELLGKIECRVLPQKLVKGVLDTYHSFGHPSTGRMMETLSRHFYWPLMYSQVKTYVQACSGCAMGKKYANAPKGKLGLIAYPDRPGAVLQIDTVGALPEVNGMSHICSIIDRF